MALHLKYHWGGGVGKLASTNSFYFLFNRMGTHLFQIMNSEMIYQSCIQIELFFIFSSLNCAAGCGLVGLGANFRIWNPPDFVGKDASGRVWPEMSLGARRVGSASNHKTTAHSTAAYTVLFLKWKAVLKHWLRVVVHLAYQSSGQVIISWRSRAHCCINCTAWSILSCAINVYSIIILQKRCL